MELSDRESGDFLVIEPTRYEFPDLVGVDYDSDWLIVLGHAKFRGEEWRWSEPCLLVGEALRLAAWLDRVARTGDSERMEFLEPNLAFEVASVGDLAVELVAFVGHESAPPSRIGDERFVPLPLRLRLRRGDLAMAATELRSTMSRFPSRE